MVLVGGRLAAVSSALTSLRSVIPGASMLPGNGEPLVLMAWGTFYPPPCPGRDPASSSWGGEGRGWLLSPGRSQDGGFIQR